MYIAVSQIQLNSNTGSYYITAQVVSDGVGTSLEAWADDDATVGQINDAIAEAARDALRAMSVNVDTDAPVVLFGGAVQAGG